MKPLTDESRIRARVFDVIRRIIDIPPAGKSLMRGARSDWLAPPHISTFKGIDPVLLYGNNEEWFFAPEDCTPLIVWPISVCLINPVPGDGLGLSVQRLTSVTPKQVRGYAHRISPFMVRRDVGAEDRGQFITGSGILSYLGGKWVDADKRTIWEGSEHSPIPTNNSVEKYPDVGGIAIAIALRHRYEWAVNIGFEKSPSVRIVTDPTGMKELFRLRDVADGKDRRDTLMTWVSDHWRQSRKDDDVETYVRKHLRGSTKFDWRGMECEIVPAAFDLEQRDRLIAERNSMRVDGIDKRLATNAP